MKMFWYGKSGVTGMLLAIVLPSFVQLFHVDQYKTRNNKFMLVLLVLGLLLAGRYPFEFIRI